MEDYVVLLVSIKDIAERVGKSKTYVSKRIADLGLRDKMEKIDNRFMLDEETAQIVIDSFKAKERPVFEEPEKESADADVIAVLREQLQEKDRQIARLLTQLEEKDRQQAELIATMQQGNYLHAETIKSLKGEIDDTVKKTAENGDFGRTEASESDSNNRKKGIWSRIFG